MKKLLTNLFLSFAIVASFQASAQYCGSSQVSFPSCGFQANYGFGDINTFHCITRGQCDSLVIPFRVYTGFTAAGNTVTIYKLRFDGIDSLPCGLCWSTSQSMDSVNHIANGVNEFAPGENGCIKIAGLTNDPPGQYKLSMTLAVRDNASTPGYDIDTIASDAGGVFIWIKVINPGDQCPDTIITANGTLHPSTSCTHTVCTTGIYDISSSFSELSVQPNPMSSEAKVTFSSEIAGNQQLRITNIVGSEVYSATIAVKLGSNETTIQKNNLPAGIYILSVGGNQGIATKKFIIAE